MALNQWWLVGLRAVVVALSVTAPGRDLRVESPEIAGLMRFVRLFTVAHSGPLGPWLYWTTGRKQIPRDGIWRRGGRSVAHC